MCIVKCPSYTASVVTGVSGVLRPCVRELHISFAGKIICIISSIVTAVASYNIV